MPSSVVQPRWSYTRRWSRVMPAHPSQKCREGGGTRRCGDGQSFKSLGCATRGFGDGQGFKGLGCATRQGLKPYPLF
jgi:hypothetical protein